MKSIMTIPSGQGVDDDVFKSRDEALPPIARSHPRTFMEALGFINRIKACLSLTRYYNLQNAD